MAFPALAEAEGKLKQRQDRLHAILDEAGPDLDMSKVKSIDGDSAAKAKSIRALNDEMTDLGIKIDDMREVAKAAKRSAEGRERDGETDTGADAERKNRKDDRGPVDFGKSFTDSAAYKGKVGQNGPEAHLDIELKALFETGTGITPETTRTGRVVDFVTRPLQIIDLIPQTTTAQTAVVFMQETTFVNNAAEIAEAGTYPESALGLQEVSSPVRKVGTWLPVTDEQLEDVAYARTYINNRLPFMVRQRLDAQILVGNGTAPNLRGILNTVGIQTQAKGTDPVPDAVYKALVRCRVTGQAQPNAAAFNPLDWQDVRLLRTADGIYIWGSPSEPGPARIWGVNVAECQGLTENTALVGDYANFSELSVKRGIDVQISNSHSTFFVEGKQAVRADIRAALVIYRPAAFCAVTGV